jgi:hypothetical protein
MLRPHSRSLSGLVDRSWSFRKLHKIARKAPRRRWGAQSRAVSEAIQAGQHMQLRGRPPEW